MALASLALTVFWATVTVAGLGCSALLPLVISFAQLESTGIAASVAGGPICISQVGYGIAAFGVEPLENAVGLHLSTVYGGATAVALLMATLSFLLVREEHHPSGVNGVAQK
jgi:hypothetical protein